MGAQADSQASGKVRRAAGTGRRPQWWLKVPNMSSRQIAAALTQESMHLAERLAAPSCFVPLFPVPRSMAG